MTPRIKPTTELLTREAMARARDNGCGQQRTIVSTAAINQRIQDLMTANSDNILWRERAK